MTKTLKETIMTKTLNLPAIGRRGFMGGAAALATLPLTRPAFAQGAEIKFWDMIWGPSGYIETAQGIAEAYAPTGGLMAADYQSIPWANWYQTFTSAAASGTTPAVSTGAAFLPFYFMDEGLMAPADNLIARLDAAGKNDFLPGTLDAMRTATGYAAVPWSIDLRVLWVRKSLLKEAGAEIPTDWASYIVAGEKLAAIDKIGLGMAASNTTTDAQHVISALMINNGGGFFAPDGSLDCVTDRNIETLEFLHKLVTKKIIDPYAASYTKDNLTQDWASGRIAMGFGQTGMDKKMPADIRDDFMVIPPITSTNGTKGTVYYLNPIMMFKTTPDQESSEAFVEHYLDNLHVFWEKGLSKDLPVKKSITDLPLIQDNPNLRLSVDEWQPVGKTIGAQSDEAFGALNAVDGGSASADFVQQIVAGNDDARQLLSDLQDALARVM